MITNNVASSTPNTLLSFSLSQFSLLVVAAHGANDPDPGGAAAEELVADQGADVGGPGDVSHRQQSHETRESSYSWFHGWLQVETLLLSLQLGFLIL